MRTPKPLLLDWLGRSPLLCCPVGGQQMNPQKPVSSNECRYLAEYRREVLGLRQSDVAVLAKCKQAWISHVEAGHLPAPWRRGPLVRAYRLEESEFIRLVRESKNAQQEFNVQVFEPFVSFSVNDVSCISVKLKGVG